ncbi:MAG: CDP-glycerol glycerophosphotransferase family protein, partial [Thermococcus sp.]|nr:CDP-glycerol glycerophosphotransferase family protein [Thermococcus sp.]
YYHAADGRRLSHNVFRMKEFDTLRFIEFLRKNRFHFVFKLHPNEEELYSREPEFLKILSDNQDVFSWIKTETLNNHEMDLYEVLNGADLLLTDYSSVYFDFLLTDKPILFLPVDIDEYRKKRGFLLEPYDFWTPGPKVYEQYDLEKEILKLLSEEDYYQCEREVIKNLVHTYRDGRSSERIWRFIKETILKT